MPLRIVITKEWNAPHTIKWTNRAWRAKWDKFPQDRILRALITRQVTINTLILEFKERNEFHG